MNRSYKCCLFLVIVFCSFNTYQSKAQCDVIPACTLVNTGLKKSIASGEIDMLRCCGDKYSFGEWATSTLAPSNNYPSFETKYGVTFENDEERECAEAQYSGEEAVWDCQYSAYNLSDGDVKTCWAEGTKESGIGEIVMTVIDDINLPVKIWSGYGKSETLYKDNNRPKAVRVFVLVSPCRQVAQVEGQYSDIKVIGKHEVELKDLNGWQKLSLPKPLKNVSLECPLPEEYQGKYYFVALEILSVYKGSKFNDTCISEISQ
jgi:hypothetical protein